MVVFHCYVMRLSRECWGISVHHGGGVAVGYAMQCVGCFALSEG